MKEKGLDDDDDDGDAGDVDKKQKKREEWNLAPHPLREEKN